MSEFIRSYGSIIVMVVQIVLAWVLWSLSRKFCTVEQCEKNRKDIVGAQDKTNHKATRELDALKNKVEKVPERTEIREVSRVVAEMNNTLGKLEGRLFGIGQAVDLINDHLLNKGRDK